MEDHSKDYCWVIPHMKDKRYTKNKWALAFRDSLDDEPIITWAGQDIRFLEQRSTYLNNLYRHRNFLKKWREENKER